MLRPFLLGSVAGYAVENALYGPRHSAIAGPLPLMPAWGIGAAVFSTIAPRLRARRIGWGARFAIYASAATAIEWAGGHAQHALGLPTTWSYGEGGTYVDVEHSVGWGVLGLLVEALTT